MSNATTKVDNVYNVDHVYNAKMIAFNPKEKGVQVRKASRVRRVREYLQQNGNLNIPAFDTTSKDLAKLAAKRAAEKAGNTRREDSDRSY